MHDGNWIQTATGTTGWRQAITSCEANYFVCGESPKFRTFWLHEYTICSWTAKPCKPAPARPLLGNRGALFAVRKFHSDICDKSVLNSRDSVSPYLNVGLCLLLQNTEDDTNCPKFHWNPSHLHLPVRYVHGSRESAFKLMGLAFIHRQHNTVSLCNFSFSYIKSNKTAHLYKH
jgi:hypothetical protein